MSIFGKRKKPQQTARNRNPEPKQKVISYYTATRNQLDGFERQSQTTNETKIEKLYSLKSKWFHILVLVVLLGCVVYMGSLGTNPHVTVVGTEYRQAKDYNSVVASAYGNDFRNKIKPLLMADRLQEDIKKAIPEAAIVSVSSSIIGHQANVKIISDEPLAIFSQPNAPDMLMSNRGRLLLSTTDNTIKQTSSLPIIQNLTGVEARAGEQFMRPDEAVALKRLIQQYASDNSKPIFTLNTNPHEVAAKEEGRGSYQVRYILDDTIVNQYGALRATEKKLQELAQQPAEYIDVRLADKAYYK